MELQPWREPANNPNDCARLEAYVTALFDGEATPEEASVARAHLSACNDCTFLWKQWGQTRYLLNTTPTPVVPPGLLLRILMACRLLSLPRRRRVQDTAALQLPVTQAMPILPAYADDIAPRPSREVPVPPDLMANILSRTTLMTLPETIDTGARFEAAQERRESPLPRGSMYQRFNRLATAFAVPALAAWFFVAMHHSPDQPLSTATIGKPTGATISPALGLHNMVQNMSERHFAAARSIAQTGVQSSLEHGTAASDRSSVSEVPDVEMTDLAVGGGRDSMNRPSAVAAPVAHAVLLPALDGRYTPVQFASAVRAPLMSWHADEVHVVSGSTDTATSGPVQPDTTPAVAPEVAALADDDQTDAVAVGDTRPVAIGQVVDDFRASLSDDAHDDAADQTAG